MERNEWVQHCKNVNRLLRQIREQGGVPCMPKEGRHFRASLEVNELVIAFDFLCWKFEETVGRFHNESTI